MNITINIVASFIHFILTYILFITALITNNINILVIILLILSIIKFSYYYFGRCILTLIEDNNYYASIVTLFSNSLTKDIHDKIGEEIIINIGLLISLNKLLFLFLIEYYTSFGKLLEINYII